MRKTSAPILVVCFGDSLTGGDSHAEADRWPARLQRLLDRSWPGGFKVRSRGTAGNTTAQGLDRIEEGVLSLQPDHVLVAFGINDCNVRPDRRTPRVGVDEFTSNLREIVRMVRAAAGIPILLASHYPGPDRREAETRKYEQGNGAAYAENFRPYHLGVRRVARQCATPLIDLPRLIARARVGAADLLTEDGVHLTPEGDRFYAEQVWRHLSA